MKKYGRKTILLIGYSGCAISMSLMAIVYLIDPDITAIKLLIILGAYGFNIFFGGSHGSTIWVNW